uniref:Uncharacterized protein n=1 Tax=Triticum urartu TaxID=4572 RepID=A0A8R7K4F8_TRIUA
MGRLAGLAQGRHAREPHGVGLRRARLLPLRAGRGRALGRPAAERVQVIALRAPAEDVERVEEGLDAEEGGEERHGEHAGAEEGGGPGHVASFPDELGRPPRP